MGETDRLTLAIGLLSASLFAYFVHVVLQWRRLSHVSGPFWAAFSKWWMVKESLKGRQPISFKEVNDKYGVFASSPLSATIRSTDDEARLTCARWSQ